MRLRTFMPQRFRRGVFGRFIPGLRPLGRWEFQHDESARRPRTFKRFDSSTAHQKTPAILFDAAGHKFLVGVVSFRIEDFNVDDYISRHFPLRVNKCIVKRGDLYEVRDSRCGHYSVSKPRVCPHAGTIVHRTVVYRIFGIVFAGFCNGSKTPQGAYWLTWTWSRGRILHLPRSAVPA